MHLRLTFAFVLTAGLLLPSTLLAQQDTVYPFSGIPSKGTITAMSKSGVTLDSRQIAINAFSKVAFGGEPPELTRARDAAATGRYEDMKEDLAKINAASGSQYVKADIAYYRALADAKLALAGNGDKEAAHAALLDFIRTNSNNFHFYPAAELLGDLALARGKFADAQTYYGPLTQDDFPELKLRAAILQAKALIPQKKFAEAQGKYEEVMGASLSTPEANRQKQFAQVGRAVCLAETGQVQQAETILSDIIRNNDPRDVELFGRTYNALGACNRKNGDLKAALLDYLHTDLMFYNEADVHAEALYHLSKLWADAAKNDDRALQAKNLLKSRYAGTVWAQLQ